MREFHLRLSEQGWQMIRAEAEVQGVSVSQFIREAALAYAIYLKAQRGAAVDLEAIEEIIRLLRE